MLINFAKKHPWTIGFYKKIFNCCKFIAFKHNFYRFRSLTALSTQRFKFEWKDRYPCLLDQESDLTFDRHYVLHTAWATRILAQKRPNEHVDISSLIYFATLVSAFLPTRYYDYRRVNLDLPGLQTGQADLLALPFPDNSITSLSCMHVVEHIGLGRYGDPLDPDGDLKAIKELKRVLAKGGNLLFVVPIGKPKIMFNAHRIYSASQITEYFSDLTCIEFTLIPETAGKGDIIKNPTPSVLDKENYGCGCFLFRKD